MNILLQIWDGFNQVNTCCFHRNIKSTYAKYQNSILIIFDLTNKESFDYIPLIFQYFDPEIINNPSILFFGNKCNLIKERKISFEEGYNLGFI